MDNLLVTTEIVAVTVLTFILALVIEPLLVMAVLGLARKAAQAGRYGPRPNRKSPNCASWLPAPRVRPRIDLA